VNCLCSSKTVSSSPQKPTPDTLVIHRLAVPSQSAAHKKPAPFRGRVKVKVTFGTLKAAAPKELNH
jgi:hypothetical protein